MFIFDKSLILPIFVLVVGIFCLVMHYRYHSWIDKEIQRRARLKEDWRIRK